MNRLNRKSQVSRREEILATAARLIANDRQHVYGTPYQNFGRIAQLWSVILGREISRAEVALCMDAVKTARLIQTPADEDEDGWIDKCGYSAIGGELSAL